MITNTRLFLVSSLMSCLPVSLALLSASFVPSPIRAETVEGLVAKAVGENPEIRFYEAEIEAAKAGKSAALTPAEPSLELSGGAKNIRHEGDGAVWRAQISQTFEFSNRLALRKALADRDIELAGLGLDQARAELSNEVRSQAGDLLLLKRQEAAAAEVRDRLRAMLEVLVQRDSGAVSARLEQRIMEASVLVADRRVSEAAKETITVRTALNMLCNRAPDAPLDLKDATTHFPAVPSMEKLKTQSLETNFIVRQRQAELRKQGLEVDLAHTEKWSEITVGPYVGGENAGAREVEGGIALSLPLPLWKRHRTSVAIAEARQKQAETVVQATLRDLERDLAVARASYATEKASLEQWNDGTEQAFAEAAADADRHFRLGAVPSSIYIEMQRQYVDAMQALTDARRQAWKHRMELERLTGSSLK